jgi:GBP family porin
MTKKILWTAALAAAASLSCGQAVAADFTLTGQIDTGLRYMNASDGAGHHRNTVDMTEGGYDSNRVIFIGNEELSPDTKIGMWLEMSFESDTGEHKTEGSIFDRGSYLHITNTHWGQLSFGRFGCLRSGATPLTYDLTTNRYSAFGTGWGDIASPMYALPFYGFSISNNVQYDTPTFGGFSLHLQHAFGDSDSSTGAVEGKSTADRYSALGITWDGAKLHLVGMADWMDESTLNESQHDFWSLIAGGHYQFDGGTKVYAWATYFKNANNIMALPGFDDYSLFNDLDQIKGYAVSLGAKIPCPRGDLHIWTLYMDADYDDSISEEKASQVGTDLKRYGFALGYTYPLSKRTHIYGVAGGYYDDVKLTTAAGHRYDNPSTTEVMIGIHHNF